MISRAIGFIICLIGLLLPWRLRVLFSEFLGWTVQLIYLSYYGTLNYILRELKSSMDSASEGDKHD